MPLEDVSFFSWRLCPGRLGLVSRLGSLNKGLKLPDLLSLLLLSKGAGSLCCSSASLGHILVGHIYSLSLVLQIWGPQGTPVHMCWECGSHCALQL